MPNNTFDVTVENGGSIFTFTPHTPEAREWITENLSLEAWQWFGPAFVVEHRYAAEIVEAMLNDGLGVE